MARFLFAVVFYTTLARWGYSEMHLICPSFIPVVNQALDKIQIPTHDRWSRENFEAFADKVNHVLEIVTSWADDTNGAEM